MLKFFNRNLNTYLQFPPLFHSDMAQEFDILPRERQGHAYFIYSIPWPLMTWRRKEPGHQQPWYWPGKTELSRSPHVKINLIGPNITDPNVVYGSVEGSVQKRRFFDILKVYDNHFITISWLRGLLHDCKSNSGCDSRNQYIVLRVNKTKILSVWIFTSALSTNVFLYWIR